jgi:hypothetical protein
MKLTTFKKLDQPIEIIKDLNWIETQKVRAVLFTFIPADIGIIALSGHDEYFYAIYLYDKLPKDKLTDLRLIVQTVVATIRSFN